MDVLQVPKKMFSPTQGGFYSLVAMYPNSKYWTQMRGMPSTAEDMKVTIPTIMLAGEKDEGESIDVYKELQQVAKKNKEKKIEFYKIFTRF